MMTRYRRQLDLKQNRAPPNEGDYDADYMETLTLNQGMDILILNNSTQGIC